MNDYYFDSTHIMVIYEAHIFYNRKLRYEDFYG